MAKNEDYYVAEGMILEVLPGNNFRVQLTDNQHVILAYMGGKMKQNKIRVVEGDRVDVEISMYDMNRGRIKFRHK